MPDQRDQPGEDLPRVGDPAGRTDPPGSRTQGAEGVISRRSPYGVEETVRRLRVLLDERDITLFAHINHAEAPATPDCRSGRPSCSSSAVPAPGRR